jgi:hypothetical protein
MKKVGALNKKGQSTSSLPFNWIFAVILIIIFVFAAIYGINKLIEFSYCTRIGLFTDNFQKEIDNAYYSSSTDNYEVEIDLPGIEKICFANLSAKITGALPDYEEIKRYELKDANVFFIPPEKSCGLSYKKIRWINLQETTKSKNPYCIPTVNKVLFLKRDYDDNGVTIK